MGDKTVGHFGNYYTLVGFLGASVKRYSRYTHSLIHFKKCYKQYTYKFMTTTNIEFCAIKSEQQKNVDLKVELLMFSIFNTCESGFDVS